MQTGKHGQFRLAVLGGGGVIDPEAQTRRGVFDGPRDS
jgi:hypothetical protein